VVRNDHVNSFVVVVHLVHTLCARTLEEAAELASQVHRSGSAEVAVLSEVGGAERMVVALQRHGLDASVRRG
jgi:ATP-dependent Clp protease adapter protein ClpS